MDKLTRLQNEVLKLIKQRQLKEKKNMTDFILSLVRTYTPIAVGAVVAWLVTLGVEVDVETQAGLVVALTGVIQAIYYTVIRLLEKKFPQIGVLLGSAKTPEYTK